MADRWLERSMVGLFLACLAGSMPVSAEETLKGYLEEQARVREDMLTGQVLDGETGRPVPEADVALPDQGYATQTGPDGRYAIPRDLGGQDTAILSVQKPGYAPFSLTVRKNVPPTLTVALQKTRLALVLDRNLRHLGDDRFSPFSDNATAFRKPSDGPGLRIPFTLGEAVLSDKPYLKIGSLIGLDTLMSHYVNRNPFQAYATPLLIKINGRRIAQVQVNGDNQQIQIPPGLLLPGEENILELETGYQFPEVGRLDYDDVEILGLMLYF